MSTFTAVGPALSVDGPLPVCLGPGNTILDPPDGDFGYAELSGDGHLRSVCTPDLVNDIWCEDRMDTSVLLRADYLQVLWVYAGSVFASVMNLEPLGDFSDVSDVDHLMGTHVLQTMFDPPVSPFVLASLPDPTGGIEPKISDIEIVWAQNADGLADRSDSSGEAR